MKHLTIVDSKHMYFVSGNTLFKLTVKDDGDFFVDEAHGYEVESTEKAQKLQVKLQKI